MPKVFYRRKLPHLQRDDKPHFVTFCTLGRWVLHEDARSIVLDCCLHDHQVKIDLNAVVVMPDHVHLIFTPLINMAKEEAYSLAEIMDAIKGASAHKINHALRRTGRVWQTESFDRVLRSSESLDRKVLYVLENPIRRGLVSRWSDYPWLWVKNSPTFVCGNAHVATATSAAESGGSCHVDSSQPELEAGHKM